MFSLIRKDLLLHKTAFYGFVPVLVVYLGYLASEVNSRNVFITFACIMATIFPMVLVTRDDKFRAETFVCSLPVTRRQVVQARYLVSWGLALALALVGLGLYSVFANQQRWAVWSASSTGRVLLLLTLGLGLGLPFAVRFGWIGLVAGLVGVQMLGIVALLVAESMSLNFGLRDAFDAVSRGLEGWHDALGGAFFLLTVLLVVVVCNLISCRIAVALFQRKEL